MEIEKVWSLQGSGVSCRARKCGGTRWVDEFEEGSGIFEGWDTCKKVGEDW